MASKTEAMGISILIPTYNRDCVALVDELRRQTAALGAMPWEIVVADDGSADTRSVMRNRRINDMQGCRYLEQSVNLGRARIRNLLAHEARYGLLLFIDSGMRIRNPHFLASYRKALEQHTLPQDGMAVLSGGYTIAHAREANPGKPLDSNLRYRYEERGRKNCDATLRSQHPYRDFHTSNFLATRLTMLTFPLDARFVHYGYEDVLWGLTLEQAGVPLWHVDNPVSFEKYETNRVFLEKTEEGLRTLYQFREELRGCSRVVALAERLKRTRVAYPLVRWCYPLVVLHIKARLTGGKPGLWLFDVYKLMYYIHLDFQGN